MMIQRSAQRTRIKQAMSLIIGVIWLLPVMFLLNGAIYRLLPNALWGKSFSIALDRSMQFALLVILFWLVASRRLTGRHIVILGGMAWLGLVPAWVALHLSLGTPPARPGQCVDAETLDLLNVSECQGRNFSMLQGRRSYYTIQGTPKKALCETILKPSKPTTQPDSKRCGLNQIDQWSRVSCELIGHPSDSHCFKCQFMAQTGDWHREVLMTDANCSRALLWRATNDTSKLPPLF